MLKAEGLKKSYGSLQVLKGVDIEIHKGEVVSIEVPRVQARAHCFTY